MYKISREEVTELKKRGFKYANEDEHGVIHKTNAHYTSYYITETPKALDALIEIREGL